MRERIGEGEGEDIPLSALMPAPVANNTEK